MKLKTMVAGSVLLWTGCAMRPPIAQEIAAVGGYGAPLTIDWQAAIKTWFFNKLKDPLRVEYGSLASIDPVGLQALRLFKTSGIGVRYADRKRPDLR